MMSSFLEMETWTVYILSCADGKIYNRCTSNFEERIRYIRKDVLDLRNIRYPAAGNKYKITSRYV
jgi:hypothetical protein